MKRSTALVCALGLCWSCSSATDGAGDGASPCSQVHLFCDDFDSGELGVSWDERNVSGGPLAKDTLQSRSAPGALRARSELSPTPRSVALYKNLSGPPGKLRCGFDVMVLARAGGYADIFELRLDVGAPGGFYYAYVQVTESGTFIGQETVLPEGKVSKLTPVADLPVGQWRHVAFETDFASFTVRYEGQPAHSEVMTRIDGTKPQMALGLVYTDGGGPFDFLFDNVACDYDP